MGRRESTLHPSKCAHSWDLYQLWLQASALMRSNVALGLNCSGNYNTFANPLSLSKPMLGNPNNPACMERLKNLFWASYLLDRQSVTYVYDTLTFGLFRFPTP